MNNSFNSESQTDDRQQAPSGLDKFISKLLNLSNQYLPLQINQAFQKKPKTVLLVVLLVFLALIFTFVNHSCTNNWYTIAPVVKEEKTTPVQQAVFEWPNDGLAVQLPVFESKEGSISTNNEDNFKAVINKVPYSDYAQYVKTCKEKGYTVNAAEEKFNFAASNENQVSLSLFYDSSKRSMTVSAEVIRYDVQLEVVCEKNIAFSTYDVVVKLDGEQLGIIEHGNTETFDCKLKSGQHTLVIEEDGYSSVSSEATFEVTADTKLIYKAHCYNGRVSIVDSEGDLASESGTKTPDTAIEKGAAEETPLKEGQLHIPSTDNSYKTKPYKEVVSSLKGLGFTNVTTAIEYDLELGGWLGLDDASVGKVTAISIGGVSDFEEGDVFSKKDKVVVTYSDYEYKNPKIKYTKCSVATLVNEMEKNPARAKDTYEGEYVIVTGRVDSIDASAGYFTLIPKGSKYSYYEVQVNSYSDIHKSSILKLNKGDTVTVRGKMKIVGEIMGYNMELYSFE